MFENAILSLGFIAALIVAGAIPYWIFNRFCNWFTAHRRALLALRADVHDLAVDLDHATRGIDSAVVQDTVRRAYSLGHEEQI